MHALQQYNSKRKGTAALDIIPFYRPTVTEENARTANGMLSVQGLYLLLERGANTSFSVFQGDLLSSRIVSNKRLEVRQDTGGSYPQIPMY